MQQPNLVQRLVRWALNTAVSRRKMMFRIGVGAVVLGVVTLLVSVLGTSRGSRGYILLTGFYEIVLKLELYEIIAAFLAVMTWAAFKLFRIWKRQPSSQPATPATPVAPPPSLPPAPPTPPTSGQVPPASGGHSPDNFNFWMLIVNLVIFTLALIMILFSSSSLTLQTLSEFNWMTAGVSLLLTQLIWNVVSIKAVNVDEQAILLFFGRFVRFVGPGPQYVPFWFTKLIRAPTGMIEKDIPADPRFIWHGDAGKGDGKIPLGFYPPTRVTFAPAPDADVKFTTFDGEDRTIPKDDAFHQRNIAEVEASYGWQINDLCKLVKQLGATNTLIKAQSQMDDMAVRTMNSLFSTITAAEANTKIEKVAGKVMEELCKLADSWGIKVTVFGIKPFNFSHKLNTAVTESAESFPKKATVVRASEGEEIRLTNEGHGKANAQYDYLAATADGEGDLAEVAATPGGQFAMAMQTTQVGLQTARAIIVPQHDLFGAAAGVMEMIRQIPGPSTPPLESPTNPPTPGQPTGGPVATAPNQPPKREPRYGSGQRKDKK